MNSVDISRAIETSMAIVQGLDLTAEAAIVLHDSNKLTLRLMPCDIVARVAHIGCEVAALEVELAQRLAEVGAPAGTLDPRVEACVYERDGFAMTLWSYQEPTTRETSPADYVDGLQRLHAGMRKLQVSTPHYTDRVATAEQVVTNRDLSPDLADADRALLTDTLRRLPRVILDHGATEQLLHGEPHPGNVLSSATGPVFIDLETCCRGPVEFDLAHVPEAVSDRYTPVNRALLRDCRHLVLAMVAAWRWELDDQFPNGKQAGQELLRVMHAGPPWPTLDTLFGRVDDRRTT
jgi:Phosphotransferase enzyme family